MGIPPKIQPKTSEMMDDPKPSGFLWWKAWAVQGDTLFPVFRDKQQPGTSRQALAPLTRGSQPWSLVMPPPWLSRGSAPFDTCYLPLILEHSVLFRGILDCSGSQVQGSSLSSDPDFLLRQKVHKKHLTHENCTIRGAKSLIKPLPGLTPLCHQLLPDPRSDPTT